MSSSKVPSKLSTPKKNDIVESDGEFEEEEEEDHEEEQSDNDSKLPDASQQSKKRKTQSTPSSGKKRGRPTGSVSNADKDIEFIRESSRAGKTNKEITAIFMEKLSKKKPNEIIQLIKNLQTATDVHNKNITRLKKDLDVIIEESNEEMSNTLKGFEKMNADEVRLELADTKNKLVSLYDKVSKCEDKKQVLEYYDAYHTVNDNAVKLYKKCLCDAWKF